MINYKNNFAKINEQILKAADESVTEAAQDSVDQIRGEVPYISGELAESYDYQKTGFASVEIGSTLERAIFTELGSVHTPPNPVASQATANLDITVSAKLKNKLKSVG